MTKMVGDVAPVQKKKIRFITPNYKELFTILDGEEIKIIHSDGEEFIRTCKFIDEYHLYVGSNIFHICEFAERMEQVNAKVEKVEVEK
jgi:hypothetical protein